MRRVTVILGGVLIAFLLITFFMTMASQASDEEDIAIMYESCLRLCEYDLATCINQVCYDALAEVAED